MKNLVKIGICLSIVIIIGIIGTLIFRHYFYFPKVRVYTKGETLYLDRWWWSWESFNGKIDGIMPTGMPGYESVIWSKRTIVKPGQRINIKFSRKPTYYRLFGLETDLDTEDLSEPLYAPEKSGIYYYRINAEWDRGGAYFLFGIEVRA